MNKAKEIYEETNKYSEKEGKTGSRERDLDEMKEDRGTERKTVKNERRNGRKTERSAI
jgi:hypothetical protein